MLHVVNLKLWLLGLITLSHAKEAMGSSEVNDDF
jgi:hypothetical protein